MKKNNHLVLVADLFIVLIVGQSAKVYAYYSGIVQRIDILNIPIPKLNYAW